MFGKVILKKLQKTQNVSSNKKTHGHYSIRATKTCIYIIQKESKKKCQYYHYFFIRLYTTFS